MKIYISTWIFKTHHINTSCDIWCSQSDYEYQKLGGRSYYLDFILNMLDEGTYKSTSRLENIYYEGTSLYENLRKNKIKFIQCGHCKNIIHGFSFKARITSGNIVSYHSSTISLHEKKHLRTLEIKLQVINEKMQYPHLIRSMIIVFIDNQIL